MIRNGGYNCPQCEDRTVINCPFTVKRGCYCKVGLVRNKYNDCFTLQECEENRKSY